jgi:alpha-methylacyl-CoA racemase
MPGPLEHLTILELAGIGPVPHCGMMLADLGARVILIDRLETVGLAPETGDILGRGKQSIAIDLKRSDGPGLVLRLAEKADALIEGFRPGVAERLGIGPDRVLAANPRIVYGRMTGWGQEGPMAREAGHDINYIALAGVLHAIGRKDDKPVVPLNLIGDFGGGALYLVFGVLAALIDARASGRGRVVDAAMVDGALSLMAMIMGRIASGHWRDGERASNALDGGVPWYDTYPTADGKYMAVGANERPFYELLCTKLGLSAEEAAWRDDPRRWPALAQRIAQAFTGRTRDEWTAVFDGSDACASPVLTLAEAAAHAHNVARGNITRRDGIAQPAAAPRFAELPRMREQ